MSFYFNAIDNGDFYPGEIVAGHPRL